MEHPRCQPRIEADEEPWIDGDVRQILDSDVIPARDPIYGDGEGHVFGPERTAVLALYPDHQAVELISESIVVTPRRAARVTAIAEHLFFDIRSEREHTMLTVGRDGTVSMLSGQIRRELTPEQAEVVRLLEERWERSEEERIAGSPDLGDGRLICAEPFTEPPVSD